MLRMRVEESLVEVVEDNVHSGAHVAVGGRIGRRSIGLDAGRDHGSTLVRELDLSARQQRSLDLVLLQGALGVRLSGGQVATGTCGGAKRLHITSKHYETITAPCMPRRCEVGCVREFSPACSVEVPAAAGAPPGSTASSSGG